MGLIIRYYIMNMLPYMLIALPILIVIRVWIYAVRKRQGLKPNMFHELGVVVFVLFLTGLASQTLIPPRGLMAGGLGIFRNSLNRINLVPFQSVIIIRRIFLSGGYPDDQIIQLLGNIGMFAVPGFMLPVLWGKFEKLKQTVLTCFFTSLAIEVAQLFTGRSTDIDDLLLNTLGGLLGFLLYAALNKTIKSDLWGEFKSEKENKDELLP
ncbi:MAG: VanZ family protein [Desulfosporosinus sp.]|nr:VanZ family protein [Desulfosporosinus sp.]